MNFTITVQRANEAVTKLNQVSAEMDAPALTRNLAKELQAIGAWLEGEVKTRTPKDTDVLRSSIFSELRIAGTSLEEVISTPLPYGPPMEFGRAPNKKMPPSAALVGWVTRKLGNPKLAYVVARAIAKKGIAPHNMFQDAWDQNLPKIEQWLNDIGIHVSRDLLDAL